MAGLAVLPARPAPAVLVELWQAVAQGHLQPVVVAVSLILLLQGDWQDLIILEALLMPLPMAMSQPQAVPVEQAMSVVLAAKVVQAALAVEAPAAMGQLAAPAALVVVPER